MPSFPKCYSESELFFLGGEVARLKMPPYFQFTPDFTFFRANLKCQFAVDLGSLSRDRVILFVREFFNKRPSCCSFGASLRLTQRSCKRVCDAMVARRVLVSLVVGLTISGNEAIQVRTAVNPIRRVVNLLQEMAKKVTEEGEQALYERFDCYCKTSGEDLKRTSKRAAAASRKQARTLKQRREQLCN